MMRRSAHRHVVRSCQRSPIMAFLTTHRTLPLRRRLSQIRSLSSSSAAYFSNNDEAPPLVELERARLGYASSRTVTEPLNLSISSASQGGHVVLGPNGSGKSLLSNALKSRKSPTFLKEGNFHVDRLTAIQHVSFESHQELLQQGGTVYKAIADGNLSKAAQFLIVRFGLFPLLYRDVRTLSTGEIRKVLLVKALAARPKLLVLDNAFDGLDVPSRENLKDLVSKTLRGFTADILVQGVSAASTAHTQVLLMTHRPEEIVPEISTVSVFRNDGRQLITEARQGRSGDTLLTEALNIDASLLSTDPWTDDSLNLPSVDTIRNWWQAYSEKNIESKHALIEAAGVSIQRGDTTLIHNLNWTLQKGQSWLIAGHNGSGKSTLSRLLARDEEGVSSGTLRVQRSHVGWCSTELHMATSQQSHRTVADVVTHNDHIPLSVASPVLQWFFDTSSVDTLLEIPFSQLSQGEQKLVLIASTIATRPQVLVLDEPCQGLDWRNRRKVLGLIERVCRATDLSLVYITHHYEEVIPSVTHVLHLKEGRDVYNGPREHYDPDLILDSSE